jgi:ribosomal protein S18 acetylase RimI-like enzyme
VGFAVLVYTFFSNGFIPLVVVAPLARRSHHGLALLADAERRCETTKLFTSTNRSNRAAQALFLRAGFVPSGQIENLDAPGDPELVYFKAVSPAR